MASIIEKFDGLKQYLQMTQDESLVDVIDDAMEYCAEYDYFGTEGQLDPRNDCGCNTIDGAIKCIDYLIQRHKEDGYYDETEEMFQEAFEEAFKICELN